MYTVVRILVGFVAFQHVAFFVLESLLFTKPIGRKIFRTSAENAAIIAPMATNQGVYNLFLAAGLLWSLAASDLMVAFQLKFFFLVCVVVAAIVGGLTVSVRILLIQGVPAGLALLLAMLASGMA